MKNVHYAYSRLMVLGFLFILIVPPQSAFAGAHVIFTTTDVTYYDGSCEVRGYFTNDGDMAAELTELEMTFEVKMNDKVLLSITKTFPMYHLYVWNGSIYHTFSFYSQSFKSAFKDNPYRWHMDWTIHWDNVKPIGM